MFAYSLASCVIRDRHDERHEQHTQAAPQRRFRQIGERLVLVYPVPQEFVQLRTVISCALPFEFRVTYLNGLFGQRKRALTLLCNERFYFVVERHPRTLSRPHPHVTVVPDGEHTDQSNAERSDSPYRPVARKISCIVLSTPPLFHGTPPVAASARRCRALLNLFWSARSISCCIASTVSVCPWDTAKWTFSRIVRRAKTSARTVCSLALGLVAFSKTSRAHSLIVCSPAEASNCAYSSSVTFVLIDFVQKEGIEFSSYDEQVPIRELKFLLGVLLKVARRKP